VQRLALLKALGDNTRYAIYLELARSPKPLATGEIAETLALHPNTVRPHLERMRDVGLLAVEVDSQGSVGRPQHRYSLAAEAPSLGLEPPAFPLLAEMLVDVISATKPNPADVHEVGRVRGEAAALAAHESGAPKRIRSSGCVSALLAELETLGYDPVEDRSGTGVVIGFDHCPYRELAEAAPELVCGLHRGLVEGFVEQFEEFGSAAGSSARESSVTVAAFHTLADREPCQVVLTHN
jgi:predicted ArsR family transcriptional regulator